MKKIAFILLTLLTFSGLMSCSHDDDVVFVAKADPEGIAFTNSLSANYTLTAATADNLAERFVWNTVNFDTPTTVTYELQGSSNSDFSDFTVIGTTSETNLSVSVRQLMSLAAEAGLDNDAATELPNSGQVYFRVRAFAGTDGGNGLQELSEPVSLTVTLPEVGAEEEEIKTQLYLVGSATAAGWDNNNNNTPLFRDPDNDNIFYYEGKFITGEFKFLEMKGAWQPQWGTNDGNTLAVNRGDSEDPGVFSIESDGFYRFMVNLEDMSFSLEPIDASAAATYDIMGIVGAGTTVGWPNDDNPTPDIQMTKSDFNEHLWSAGDIVLTDGPAKFRANLAWDVNWGSEIFPSAKANMNGADIPGEEGTYTVYFNDLSGRFIFIPVEEN